VDLVGGTTLIWPEHNDVWGDVGELLLVKSLVVAQELEVSATTLEAICTKKLVFVSRACKLGNNLAYFEI
tara:strand:+ start:439 stop:648 length:210 start_codon:yes stop_codon:yes gene_type:complete